MKTGFLELDVRSSNHFSLGSDELENDASGFGIKALGFRV